MLGEPIPSNTQHAISVSLPTWRSNVAYEENEEWVIGKMKSGYPRFFIHPEITLLEQSILDKYGIGNEKCMIFPSEGVTRRCREFVISRLKNLNNGYSGKPEDSLRLLRLVSRYQPSTSISAKPDICILLFPQSLYPFAREFWQHTGEGISSRRAVFVRACLDQNLVGLKQSQGVPTDNNQLPRGPRRYSKHSPAESQCCNDVIREHQAPVSEGADMQDFIEQRFGRNLEADSVQQAKLTIKQRIAGSVDLDEVAKSLGCTKEGERRLATDDIYLFPTGMSAIYNAHRLVQELFGSQTMIEFGFPYIDTLKVLQKFGNGCLFLGHGDEDDLDKLELALKHGERFSALFCEFPSNPLLKSPNLRRLRDLADHFGFLIVVDETIGNFVNVDVLPYADILVSSLTKVFSGDSNVMGGSCILNSSMQYYNQLKNVADQTFEDNYWDEDILFMERNSRDFASRVLRINANAEALCSLFLSFPTLIKQIYYPKYDKSRVNYDTCKCQQGGYGGLLSITFVAENDAMRFYDKVNTAKGPSLGTNFTLTSPYAILAHYNELDWIAQYGVESHLIRISVGLEDTAQLLSEFKKVLQELQAVQEE